MIHRFDRLEIDVPAGLHDATLYRFGAPDGADLGLEYVSGGEGSRHDQLAEKTQHLSALYGPAGLGPIHDVPTAVGPASWQKATVSIAAPIDTCMAFVQIGQGLAFFDTTADDAEPRLLHALQTARYVEDAGSTSAWFVRRYAGRLSFELPASYSAPEHFLLTDGDLKLSISILKSADWAEPRAEEVAYVGRGRLTLARTDGPRAVSIHGHAGREALWEYVEHDATGKPVGAHRVCQLVVALAGTTFVRMRGIAPQPAWPRLTLAWQAVHASLREGRSA